MIPKSVSFFILLLCSAFELNVRANSTNDTAQNIDTQFDGIGLPYTPTYIHNRVDRSSIRLWNTHIQDTVISTFYHKDIASNSSVALWKFFTFKIGSRGQFLLHGKYFSNGDSTAIKDENFLNQRSGYTIGSRLRLGTHRGAIMLEANYSNIEFTDYLKDDYFKTLLGIEYRIDKKLWILLTVGKVAGENLPVIIDPFLSAKIQWTFSHRIFSIVNNSFNPFSIKHTNN